MKATLEIHRLDLGDAARDRIAERSRGAIMKTALAVSAALLLAGTAYVLPAHAQTAPQTPGAAPQTQMQTPTSGSAAYGTQPSGRTAPMQTQSTATQMGTPGEQPQGSFRSSCNDVRMQGQTLIAFCPKPDGTWQTSAIGPVSQCVGDIQNVNGQLTCNETGIGSSTPPARLQSPPTQQRY